VNDSGAHSDRSGGKSPVTSLVLAGLLGIALGSVLPDFDHFFEGQGRTWGHTWYFPLVVSGIILLAFICRQVLVVLRGRK
jgi:hypothetical protein